MRRDLIRQAAPVNAPEPSNRLETISALKARVLEGDREAVDRLAHEHQDVTVHRRIVDTQEEAERVRFVGSPTILIDGVDPWTPEGAPVGLSCRMFTTPDGLRGSPTWDQLEAETASRQQGTATGSL